MSTIYCFAGPNGSGKSSLYKSIVDANHINCEYVNPDVIATMEPFASISDYEEKNKKAGAYAKLLRQKYVEEGKSFAFETVFSHPSHLEFLQSAKEKGYEIVLIYVTTQDPSINVDRVANRVSQGGHNVETDKIISRYYRSLELLPSAIGISDKAFVFDNTVKHSLSIAKFNDQLYSLTPKKGIPNPLTSKVFKDEHSDILEIPQEIIGDLSQQVSFTNVAAKINTQRR